MSVPLGRLLWVISGDPNPHSVGERILLASYHPAGGPSRGQMRRQCSTDCSMETVVERVSTQAAPWALAEAVRARLAAY